MLWGDRHTALGKVGTASLEPRAALAISRGQEAKRYPYVDPNEDAVLAPLREVAGRHGTSLAAVAIAWTTVRGEHVLPIPGSTDPGHLREEAAAAELRLTAEDLALLDGVVAVGDRY